MRSQKELVALLDNRNVLAFVSMLKVGEGTTGEHGYSLLFGGDRFAGADGVLDTFDDFADHPRKSVTRTMKGKTYTSTAAGAYQIIVKTWDGLVAQWGFKDFSPTSQDRAAVALIIGRGAIEDVLAGRFEDAVKKCAKEWASLPGSPYGQPVITIARAKESYESHGGLYTSESPDDPGLSHAADVTDVPLPQPAAPALAAATAPRPRAFASNMRAKVSAPTVQLEKAMPPFLLAALPSLIGLIPQLGAIFADTPNSQRNVAAATIVANVAKEAIGAANEQDLVEKLANDPAAAETAKAAIQANWWRIDEVGGGVAAARTANAEYGRVTKVTRSADGTTTTSTMSQDFWHVPAFWITFLLLIMPFMLLTDVFYVHPDAYDGNLRVQIVTAVLMVISIIGGYWLGTSFSGAKKNDVIAGMAASAANNN